MALDPHPNTADPVLERRLQALFSSELPTREPERQGFFFDPKTGNLCVKYAGKVYVFEPKK